MRHCLSIADESTGRFVGAVYVEAESERAACAAARAMAAQASGISAENLDVLGCQVPPAAIVPADAFNRLLTSLELEQIAGPVQHIKVDAG
jgi:hypothetical protein